jgi:hypothetical protein
MADVQGLPENFDPEDFEVDALSLDEGLKEGVTVLNVVAAKKAADGAIRCWECRRAEDGSMDCVRIDCPETFPKTLKKP